MAEKGIIVALKSERKFTSTLSTYSSFSKASLR